MNEEGPGEPGPSVERVGFTPLVNGEAVEVPRAAGCDQSGLCTITAHMGRIP